MAMLNSGELVGGDPLGTVIAGMAGRIKLVVRTMIMQALCSKESSLHFGREGVRLIYVFLADIPMRLGGVDKRWTFDRT